MSDPRAQPTPPPDALPPAARAHAGGDQVSVIRWFIFYAALIGALGLILAALLSGEPWRWTWRPTELAGQLRGLSPAIKLLTFGIYISLANTFFPLPTNPMVAIVATQEAAITGNVWTNTLIVAAIAATASTIANLNDYHLVTLLLRSPKIALIRATHLYHKTAVWFHGSPFGILVLFNVIPIPVDVVRVLAITCRYPRAPFAAANFLGRLIRYTIIAAGTFWISQWRSNAGWIVVVALLVTALGMLALKGLWRMRPAFLRPKPNPEVSEASEQMD